MYQNKFNPKLSSARTLNDLARHTYDALTSIMREFKAIQKSGLTGGGSITVSSGSGSGGSSSASTSKFYRGDSSVILSTGTTVPFSKPLNDPIVIPISCKASDGTDVAVTIFPVSVNGFFATPIEDATLVWRAQPNWIPRFGIARIETTPTVVNIPVPYDDDQYSIYAVACIGLTSGYSIGVEITAHTATDFTASASEASILYYETEIFS